MTCLLGLLHDNPIVLTMGLFETTFLIEHDYQPLTNTIRKVFDAWLCLCITFLAPFGHLNGEGEIIIINPNRQIFSFSGDRRLRARFDLTRESRPSLDVN